MLRTLKPYFLDSCGKGLRRRTCRTSSKDLPQRAKKTALRLDGVQISLGYPGEIPLSLLWNMKILRKTVDIFFFGVIEYSGKKSLISILWYRQDDVSRFCIRPWMSFCLALSRARLFVCFGLPDENDTDFRPRCFIGDIPQTERSAGRTRGFFEKG